MISIIKGIFPFYRVYLGISKTLSGITVELLKEV